MDDVEQNLKVFSVCLDDLDDIIQAATGQQGNEPSQGK
jgi:hypothetical protein